MFLYALVTSWRGSNHEMIRLLRTYYPVVDIYYPFALDYTGRLIT